VIKQLIGEMGNFTQVREDESPAVQLGRFVLGGIGWFSLRRRLAPTSCCTWSGLFLPGAVSRGWRNGIIAVRLDVVGGRVPCQLGHLVSFSAVSAGTS